MGVNLKYDTLQMDVSQKNVDDLISKIETARDAMRSGLEQVRKDWASEGGDAFFESIDNDWETSVQNCIDVLGDLSASLKDAITKYNEISDNASTYLKF